MPTFRSRFLMVLFLAVALLPTLSASKVEAQQVGAMFGARPPAVSLKGETLVIELKAPTGRLEIGRLTQEQLERAKKSSGLPSGWKVKPLGGGRIVLEGPALAPGQKIRVGFGQASAPELHFVASQGGKTYHKGNLKIR